jgi:WD40 repeat protein
MRPPRGPLSLAALLLLACPAAAGDAAPSLPGGAVACLGDVRFRHGERINCLAFSPDGKALATGSHDRTVRFWDPATGRELRTLGGRNNFVPSLAFSADGRLFAAEMGDGAVHLLDARTGRELRKVPTQFADLVTLSADGKLLGTVERDWAAHVYETATGREVLKLAGASGTVSCLAFSPDGKLLATSGGGSTISLRDATGKELAQLTGHEGTVHSLAFSPDGKRLASSGGPFDRGARLWDVAARKELRHFKDTGFPAFSPDGRTLALTNGGQLLLWDLEKDRERHRFPYLTAYFAAAFSPDGKTVAAAAHQSRPRLWDVATGKELFPAEGHTGGVTAVAFSPDGKTLASSSWDLTVRLWDVAAGKEVGRIKGLLDGATGLAFSPDGKLLSSDDRAHRLRYWDPATGKEVVDRRGPAPRAAGRDASPDGRLVASATGPGVKVWEEGTGKEVLAIREEYGVHAVAFSPDGRLLATGAGGYTPRVRLWESASGQEVLALAGHRSGVRSVAFSPDGRSLASGSDDGTVLVWSAEPRGRGAGPRDVEALWKALLDADAASAYRAVWDLAAAGEKAVEYLRPRVRPAANTEERIRRLVAELDHDEFSVREAASAQLRVLGARAETALRRALEGNPSAEVARRAEELLKELKTDEAPPPGLARGEALRTVRAIDVLERVGGKEARGVLEALAQGDPDARETRDARAALKRLAGRP